MKDFGYFLQWISTSLHAKSISCFIYVDKRNGDRFVNKTRQLHHNAFLFITARKVTETNLTKEASPYRVSLFTGNGARTPSTPKTSPMFSLLTKLSGPLQNKGRSFIYSLQSFPYPESPPPRLTWASYQLVER